MVTRDPADTGERAGPDGAVDVPAPGARVDPRDVVVAGWVRTADGSVPRVEAYLDGVLLGQARGGRPRPDVAEAMGDPGAARSGFELRRALPPGDRTSAARLEVVVRGDDGRELRWDPIEVYLLAGSELSGPPPDVVTGMEHPRAGDVIGPEELDVVGWAYVRDGAVSTVSVRLDGALLGRASLGRPRPDVAAEVDDPRAVLSGVEFHHALDPVDRPTPALLEVSARLLDGREVPWESVPVVRVPCTLRAAAVVPRPRSRRPTVRRRPTGAVRVLVSARGLDRGGSQLRMAELVGHLSRVGGFDVTVATGADGPLREVVEAAGATVRVVPDPPMDDVDGYERELASWRHWMDGRFDLVVGATITSFAAVDLAQRLGIPSVIRLGEAEPLRTVVRWIYGEFDPGVQDRARRALAGADAVVSISSRAIDNYRADGVDATFVLLRTGVDLAAATAYRESSDRDGCRRQLGIPVDARLLVCAGALWAVKGQALLVTALAQHRDRYGDLLVVLLGDRDADLAEAVSTYTRATAMADAVRILPHTDDLRPWWRAADVAVCPSESETFPSAVLEAVAHRLPVLACDVGDVARVVEPGVNGWIVPPSDLAALVAALDEVAASPVGRLGVMGEAGRRRIAAYDRTTNLDRWVELLRYASGATGTAPDWLTTGGGSPAQVGTPTGADADAGVVPSRLE